MARASSNSAVLERKRQQNRDNGRKYRERAKQNLQAIITTLTPPLPDAYNLDFPTFGSSGIEELKTFIQALDKRATWARSREDCLSSAIDAALKGRRQNRLQTLLSISSLLSSPQAAEPDLIRLTSSNALEETLATNFCRPILYRATRTDGSASGEILGLDAFWDYLRERTNKKIDVYDYSVDEPTDRTRQYTVEQVISHWSRPQHERPALNLQLLNLDNWFESFCPTEVLLHDLGGMVSRMALEHPGRTGSKWKGSDREEFFLLSGANAVSPIHVDTGGQLTWIKILKGRRIWYFPRALHGSTESLANRGPQDTRMCADGWARVNLCAGDVLIMPPSCPHAVYTPEDCLAVTGSFYTAAHLGSSLRGLQLQEAYPEISNEDLKPEFYRLLSHTFTHYDRLYIRDTALPDRIHESTICYFEAEDVALAISLPTRHTHSKSESSRALERVRRRRATIPDNLLHARQELLKILRERVKWGLESTDEEDVDIEDNEHDHLEKASGDEASSDADEDDDPEDLEEGLQ